MLDNLTIKEVKEILNLFGELGKGTNLPVPEMDSYWIGKKVIVRTYSAGVFFGEIWLKSKDEVIIKDARRLYYWETVNKGISLQEVANEGLTNDSKVCQALEKKQYLIAIELIECTDKSIKNIEGQNDYTA